MNLILPLSYLGSIEYYAYILVNSNFSLEVHEHFVKQSIRNTCLILGANGIQKISVPINGRGKKILTKDITISYQEPWQRVHTKAICSAYNSSPFFEYYNYKILPIIEKKHTFLIDLNTELQQTILELIKVKCITVFTESYKPGVDYKLDLRTKPSFKHHLNFENQKLNTPYFQVFNDKFNFHPNLSIIDLLFNTGPQANEYLKLISSN